MKRDYVPIQKALVGPDQRWRISTDLTQDEVYAIGYATVMWAYLEHALLVRTVEMSKRHNLNIPEDTFNLSFTKRLRAWRLLVEKAITNSGERSRWLKLASRIANAESDRHKISHGLWDFDPKSPDQTRVSSFRPPYEYNEIFDYNKMCDLCSRLARINFELTYPNDDPFAPIEGEDEDTPFSYASRSLLQRLAGSNPEDPGLQPATLPAPRPPLSPSRG